MLQEELDAVEGLVQNLILLIPLFCGKVEGLKKDTILFEGNSVKELKEDFENAIDSYLELCKKRNEEPEKQYKGSFNVRIKPELHREAAIVAKRNNISLNQLVERAIINQLKTN